MFVKLSSEQLKLFPSNTVYQVIDSTAKYYACIIKRTSFDVLLCGLMAHYIIWALSKEKLPWIIPDNVMFCCNATTCIRNISGFCLYPNWHFGVPNPVEKCDSYENNILDGALFDFNTKELNVYEREIYGKIIEKNL